ncbi:MAG: response regulator [Nitrospira sp.]|nr:response regulator [Nitrospira sp.]MBX3122570.1 response regulator [Nitrospira sp.]MBX3349068.1 response regulator [Nitrospira sp.]MBX3368817.1 response regulator [Nitrospira sp.]MCW5793929.1 response regulator [Nitrospira sp.]
MSIMIVEDNIVSAKLVVGLLQKAGYQTVLVNNGKEALELLPTLCNIQLIITDYLMPEMNGIELIKHLKMVPSFSDIPVIILSAHCDVPTAKIARSLHCNGFLVKPVKKEQLLERVEQVLSNQPHVLRSKFDVSDTLQIGDEEYQALIGMLAAQVDEGIPIAVLEEATSDEPISEAMNQSLSALAESATLLGADKFSRLYASLQADKVLTRAQLSVLLRALQELSLELRAHGFPQKLNDTANHTPDKASAA